MELRDFILAELDDAHRMIDAALTDMTEELAHWEPGGTANTIAQLLAHMSIAEDNAISRAMKGGQSLFESQGWAEKTGIPAGRGAVWQKGWQLNLDGYAAYSQAVRAAAVEHLKTMDLNDLEREVEWGPAQRPINGVLRISVINHILGHTGEISALKGINGLNGLPI